MTDTIDQEVHTMSDILSTVSAFQDFCLASDKAPRTSHEYSKYVGRFLVWLGHTSPTQGDVLRWLTENAKLGVSNSWLTVARAALKSYDAFVTYSTGGQLVPAGRRSHPVRAIPVAAEEDEIEAVLRVADDRTRLTVLLMADIGLRRAEVASLRWEDVSIEKRELDVLRKGGFVQTLPYDITGRLRDEMEKQQKMAGPVIPGSGGNQREGSLIDQIVKAVCKDASIRPLNCHSFRHRFAREAARGGASSSALQRMLGHSSLRTTEEYLRTLKMSSEELRVGMNGNGGN
jgi:integrase